MKVGFVGTITVFRQVDHKGMRIGQIDVIQYGDHRFTSKVYTINVLDQANCGVLLEIMEKNPLPLIRAILWLEINKTDIVPELIQLVSVSDSLLSQIEETAAYG